MKSRLKFLKVIRAKPGTFDLMIILDVSGSMDQNTASKGAKIGTGVASGVGLAGTILGIGLCFTGIGAAVGIPLIAASGATASAAGTASYKQLTTTRLDQAKEHII